MDDAKLKAAKENSPSLGLGSFFDLSKPWVLVPNGSLLGLFDWVSLNIEAIMYSHGLIFSYVPHIS